VAQTLTQGVAVNTFSSSDALANRVLLGLLHEDLKGLSEALERNSSLLQSIERKLGQGQVEYLSIKEVASFAGLSPSKIRREIKAGRLAAYDTGTPSHPHYRIAKTDLLSWLEKNKGGRNVPPEVPIQKRKIKSWFFGEI
jgi:excisionase family DNA binding protein